MAPVTVAIPVRNGGALLEQTLAAIASQRLPAGTSLQLLVCDSGSTDGSVALARAGGADVFEIDPWEFSHGGTRNLLMERADGTHVAFLTQDAVPADDLWLDHLLAAFALADDIALAFGPYLPRLGASPMVARELTEWFRSFSPHGTARVDRLDEGERQLPARSLLGRRGYFTDANGCVSRAAWESVRFRPVSYAEDHVLAHDMLRAGFAKAYVPDAAVIHSHDYTGVEWLRRSFDEARAMHEVYGLDEPGRLPRAAMQLWGLVGADLRWARAESNDNRPLGLVARSAAFHLTRTVGTILGTRAGRLPRTVIRRLSLERRAA